MIVMGAMGAQPSPSCALCRKPVHVQPRCSPAGDTICLDCYRADNLRQPAPGLCVNCGEDTDERNAEGLFCHLAPCEAPACLCCDHACTPASCGYCPPCCLHQHHGAHRPME
jgi:hypothetical protein